MAAPWNSCQQDYICVILTLDFKESLRNPRAKLTYFVSCSFFDLFYYVCLRFTVLLLRLYTKTITAVVNTTCSTKQLLYPTYLEILCIRNGIHLVLSVIPQQVSSFFLAAMRWISLNSKVKSSQLFIFTINLHFITNLVAWQSRRSKVVVPFYWTAGPRLPFVEKKPSQ